MSNWYREAVYKKAPYKLGWKKTDSMEKRRRRALASRPKNWSLKNKYLSVARALQALANVTRDRETRMKAKKDAQHFLALYKRKK